MRALKKAVAFGLITGLVVAGLYFFLFYERSSGVKNEVTKTDEQVASMDKTTDRYLEETSAHERQVVERTVIIREAVAEEVHALTLDGLANLAIDEITIWRGSAGDSPETRPPAMDDAR